MASVRFADLPKSAQRRIAGQHKAISAACGGVAKQDNSSPYADEFGRKLAALIPDVRKEYRNPVPGRRFRLDYALPSIMLAVEIDGYRPHGLSMKGFQTDRHRQNLLVLSGWRILRFTIRDLRIGMDQCLDMVLHASETLARAG